MRWPYRFPHILTPGMRRTLRAVAQVSNQFHWATFRPRNIDARLTSSAPGVLLMGSADQSQALIWAARDTRRAGQPVPLNTRITLSGVAPGKHLVTLWDTSAGIPLRKTTASASAGKIQITLPRVDRDVAVTIRSVQR